MAVPAIGSWVLYNDVDFGDLQSLVLANANTWVAMSPAVQAEWGPISGDQAGLLIYYPDREAFQQYVANPGTDVQMYH